MRLILAISLALVFITPARAQSTAFTYQGKLTSNAQPAEGNHDFRFRLYDAATGGTQIGTTQCTDNLSVTGGVFTATIDFGQQYITTGQRFLEIEVRADTGLNCSNLAGFVTLVPRQAVTPAPSATHAMTAFALAAADGSPSNAVVVDSVGKLGVGTATPTHIVHIANIEPTIALQDTYASGGAGGQQVGYISYRDNTNTLRGWEGFGTVGDPDFSIVNARPSGDIVFNPFSGNVGVGTASPTAKLEVHGSVKLGNAGEFFAIKSPMNDRILRGFINANGTINTAQSSTGFTITHTLTGVYTINFNQPFTSPPTLVVGAAAPCCKPQHNGVSATSAFVHVNSVDSPFVNVDSPFTFIIIGQ